MWSDRIGGGGSSKGTSVFSFYSFLDLSSSVSLLSLFNLDSDLKKKIFRNFFMRQVSVLLEDNFMLFHRRGETNSSMFFTGHCSSCVLGV